jgi:hypothetical protein
MGERCVEMVHVSLDAFAARWTLCGRRMWSSATRSSRSTTRSTSGT